MTLYKYLAPERVDVLERRRIRFTQPAALNDPFELQPYFESVVDRSFLLDELGGRSIDITPQLTDTYHKLDERLRAHVSLEQFLGFVQSVIATDEGQRLMKEAWDSGLDMFLRAASEATPNIRDQWRNSFGKRVGILSLSEVPDSRLMWAHYGGQHAGLIIGFDQAHPYFDRRRSAEDEFYHLRRVQYREPTAYRTLVELDGEKVFLSKSPDWSYEREWRMLAPIDDATETVAAAEPIALFEFPAAAVNIVVLGARAGAELINRIDAVLRRPEYRHVVLQRAVLDPITAGVRIDSIQEHHDP